MELVGIYLVHNLCHKTEFPFSQDHFRLVGFDEEGKEDSSLNESCILEHSENFFNKEDRLLSFVLTHTFTTKEFIYHNPPKNSRHISTMPPFGSITKSNDHTYYIKVCEEGSPTNLKAYIFCRFGLTLRQRNRTTLVSRAKTSRYL